MTYGENSGAISEIPPESSKSAACHDGEWL